MKTILFMYSLECFLFKRMNRASRDKDSSAIKTLGPYAVAISKIINSVQQKRLDKRVGQFTCFRGMALPQKIIQKWCKKKSLHLDGYISASLDEKLAMYFANQSQRDNVTFD